MEVYFDQNVEVLNFTWRIFDRWGSLVSEADKATEKWDGRFKGMISNSGVFVYFVEARVVACGQVREIFKEESVVVLR